MRLLGIDLGTKKCGIAMTDSMQILAQPITTIFYKVQDYDFLIKQILEIIDKNKPFEKIIMGISKNSDGSLSNMGKITMNFYKKLKLKTSIEIVLFDERNTSKESSRIMIQMKLNNKKKKQLKDAIAAQKILEKYLNIF